ncbi:MAG: PLDc_N domain-containing protein [Methanosarcinaceae archaeon]|nr:PLDc_N domain-containing protein [Methanosarcinaceae archaeon]
MLDTLSAGIPFLNIFLLAGIGLLGTIFWIWMLLDCAMKEPSEGNDKLIWVIIILFAHLPGALLYLLFRRPKRIREHGR